MAVTKTWKVYGAAGHRQKESFNNSFTWNFTGQYGRGLCIIEVENSDKTGTNDYSIVRITADTEQACIDELDGQISDGIFENYRVGKVEEIL